MILKKKNYLFTKYLFIGLINTVFGYVFTIIFFSFFYSKIGIIFVSLITSSISISFSFLNYKFFFFKTKNKWLTEYIKFCLSNLFLMFISAILLFLTFEKMSIKIYFSLLITISITAVLGYFLNRNFSFKEIC
jgi:putative flippase GtrA